MSKALPANVALQSFDVVLGNTTAVLLRLRHMFAAHENPVLSQPVTVSCVVVDSELPVTVLGVCITRALEWWYSCDRSQVDLVNLVNPALLRVTDTQPLTLNANKALAPDARHVDARLGFQTAVTLNPLETKTFMLTVAAV